MINMLQKGQRVQWNDSGEYGTVQWVTTRGSFAVQWDGGQHVEYNIDPSAIITILP